MTFKAFLSAQAHRHGRAQMKSLYRHRSLVEDPICIVPWQLGAEAFSVGAVAVGRQATGFNLYVPGYPLNRSLLFESLLGFAREFCAAFEAPVLGPVEDVERGGSTVQVPVTLPQIIVANGESIGLLQRLGRRLAYLSPDGAFPAHPDLIRLGRHLQWLGVYARTPGQQLIIPLAEMLADDYAVGMSDLETRSLAAMDAWIEPPPGEHGFRAATRSEGLSSGPIPDPEAGRVVYELMQEFNRARAGSTDPAVVRQHIAPLADQYLGMTVPAWELIWRVVDRERRRTEADSVDRRVREDRIAFASHMAWMNGPAGGRRRARKTSLQAIRDKRQLEAAASRLIAEETTDDALRMAPHLLTDKAFAGEVLALDENRFEPGRRRPVRRPSVLLATDEPCHTQPGTAVWWSAEAGGARLVIDSVVPVGSGSHVSVVIQTSTPPQLGLPAVGDRVCFSQFTTAPPYQSRLPDTVPWTVRAPEPPQENILEAANDSDEAYGLLEGRAA